MNFPYYAVDVVGGTRGTFKLRSQVHGFICTSLMLKNQHYGIKYESPNSDIMSPEKSYLIDNPFRFVVVLSRRGIINKKLEFLNCQLKLNRSFRDFIFKILNQRFENCEVGDNFPGQWPDKKNYEVANHDLTFLRYAVLYLYASIEENIGDARSIISINARNTAIEYLQQRIKKTHFRTSIFSHPDKRQNWINIHKPAKDDDQEFVYRTDIIEVFCQLSKYWNTRFRCWESERTRTHDVLDAWKVLDSVFFQIFGSCEFVENEENMTFQIFTDEMIWHTFNRERCFICDDFIFYYGECVV